eukprot:scaffold4410_cov127-Skeletonema_marinoi.AAC.1
MSSGKAVMTGPPTVQTPQPQHDSKQAEEVTTCAQYILDQVPDDGLGSTVVSPALSLVMEKTVGGDGLPF